MLSYAHLIKKPHLLLSGLAVLAGLLLAVSAPAPAPAYADETDGTAKCTTDPGGEQGVYISIGIAGQRCIPVSDGGLQGNPIYVYLIAVLQIASGLVGLAVVGGLTWGAVLYTTARANAGQVEKAKLVMVNSIIGLMLFIFLFAIMQFAIPGGLFA